MNDSTELGKQIVEILHLQAGDTYELLACKGNPYYLLVKRIPNGMTDVPKWYEPALQHPNLNRTNPREGSN